MKNFLKQMTVAVGLALMISACSGADFIAQSEETGNGGKTVIGNPNALGTVGVPNHNQLRGKYMAMMGLATPVTALDIFLTTNKNIFNGTGEANSVTPEEIQKRVEASFIACNAGIVARATNHFGPIFTGVNFGVGPAVITDAKIEQIAKDMRKIFTGQTEAPADLGQTVRDFRTQFVAGATNNAALTTALMNSLCSMLSSSPMAMAIR